MSYDDKRKNEEISNVEKDLLDENLFAEPERSYGSEAIQDYNYGSSEEKVGEKTIEDYMALPEGERVELIDGVFYDMASPLGQHQLSLGEIVRILGNYVDKNKGNCKVFQSPMDVQLDGDDKTVVQPDAFILCDRDKYVDGRVIGAPDLVIEVLSPSNRWHDMGRKLRKYKNAGVREYWVVDAEKEVVVIHYFEKDDYAIYSFDDEVPVGIWDGECKVDFKAVKKYMDW